MGGVVGRDRDRAVHRVPRQRDHALDEIHIREHVTVGRGPSPEQPACLTDPVGGLVEAPTTDQDQALRGEREGPSPYDADALGEVQVIECAA